MADASKPKPPTPPQPGSSGMPPGFIPVANLSFHGNKHVGATSGLPPGFSPVAEISYHGTKQGGVTNLIATVDWKSPGDIHLTTGAPPGARCQANLTEQQRQSLDEAFQYANDALCDGSATMRDAWPF